MTIRLTAAQAMVRWLSQQKNEAGDRFIQGCWAIFGHGNVAGIGEALQQAGADFPTWRGQNEQTMAHAAIAFAKAKKRRQAQAVTTSIGPGATNLVTAAALAHVNRLPLLMICGDVFANRRPDPVLQQIEDFDDGTVSANDCFRPVVRYFDRITRPEQLLTALPRAVQVKASACTSFCQDVQAEAFDWPEEFFAPKVWRLRRIAPDTQELSEAIALIKAAKAPVILAGGGVIYSQAEVELAAFAKAHNIEVTETQAGKSALAQSHQMNLGAAGVDGSAAANKALKSADLVIGIGTRLQDFTTGSRSLFAPEAKILSINVTGYDAAKHGAVALLSDAKVALEKIGQALGARKFSAHEPQVRQDWLRAVEAHCAAPNHNDLPSDAQVIGAVQRAASKAAIAMGAAGTMPGALKLLWQPEQGGYHMEYGYSCMGYEIAGAMGIKLALPKREVICFTGDGSYMMANSELATAVMRRIPFTVILTDNRGYGCINRLQKATGGEAFNNLYLDSNIEDQPQIDYAAHARSMGAYAVKVPSINALEDEIKAARERSIPSVLVIETSAAEGPGFGEAGHWWDVAVPQVANRPKLQAALEAYLKNAARVRLSN